MSKIECKNNLVGIKMTDQRRTILKILKEANDHPSVEELYERACQENPAISLATVYRTLNLFNELDIVIRHDFRGNFSRYEIRDEQHHDHLIDIETGEVFEFHNDELDALKKRVADEMGFVLLNHKLELYGKKK